MKMSEVLSLDTDMAIAGMGNKDIYLCVLKKFIPNRGETVQSIRDALAVADLNKAKHLAHTLKGIAATIGAIPLSESIRKLEVALCEDTGVTQLLESVSNEMGIVTTQITAYLKAHETSPQLKAQPAELASLMVQLNMQLEDFDCAAAVTMLNIRQQVEGADIEKHFDQLDCYINAYDFENALVEIQRLSGVISVVSLIHR